MLRVCPPPEKAVRTDAGLASELRLSVMRLRRRLAAERDPDNPLSMGQMAVLGALYRNGDQSVGELAAHERVQPPSMTRTVNCLAERRVRRSPGARVRRPPGRGRPDRGGPAVLLADRARRDEWLSRRLAGLSAEERDALRRATPILQRLAQSD